MSSHTLPMKYGKIAIVTDDGVNVCAHFGRANYYEVVTVVNGTVTERERREKPNFHGAAHANVQSGNSDEGHRHSHSGNGQNGHGHHSSGNGQNGHGHNSSGKHQAMAGVISDCDMILAKNMGHGAYMGMLEHGIEPCVTNHTKIDDAIAAVLDGSLINHTERLH